MSEYFNENRKFIDLNGVLGRRDFIINFLIIEIMEGLICTTPAIYLLLFKPELVQTFQGGNGPFWFVLLFAITGLIASVMYFPSFVRRVRDILGSEDNNKIYLISSVLAVFLFATYTPVGNFYMIRWIGLFILISLMLWEGKITGEKPKSDIIKFNWGAFVGTWLWGLFNKSPITFLILPLLVTTSWFPFMLICGLKGNEWSYNKKKSCASEEFHKLQQNQTIIFLVLAPVISFIFLVLLFFGVGTAFYQYTKVNQSVKQQFINSFKNYEIKAIEVSFEKIEKDNDNYKFYLNPQSWMHVQNTAFRNAVNYVLIKEGVYESVLEGSVRKQYEAINKVKIYSSFNNEILAECNYSESDIAKIDSAIKQNANIIKTLYSTYDACKFNKTPTFP